LKMVEIQQHFRTHLTMSQFVQPTDNSEPKLISSQNHRCIRCYSNILRKFASRLKYGNERKGGVDQTDGVGKQETLIMHRHATLEELAR